MRVVPLGLLLSFLAPGMALGQAPPEPPSCEAQGIPRVAVTIPPGQTQEQVLSRLVDDRVFAEGTQVVFLRYGERPKLENPDEVHEGLLAIMHRMLDWGEKFDTTATVLLSLDADGHVRHVTPGTYVPVLDSALVDIWTRARFRPYAAGGCRVAGWFHVPLFFGLDSMRATMTSGSRGRAPWSAPVSRSWKVGDVVHVAELKEALRSGLAPDGARLLYTVWYSEVGVPDSVRPTRNISADTVPWADAVAAAISRFVKPLHSDGAPAPLTLVVTAGDEPRVRVAHPPSLPVQLNGTAIQGRIRSFVARYPRASRPQGDVEVKVRALMAEDGSLQDPQVFHSSGIPAIDAEAVQLSREYRFRPPRYEGFSMTVYMIMSMDFNFP